MNKELKDKWTAALRSGEYKQHRYAACDEGPTAFCCLGVLGVVAAGGERSYVNATKGYELSGQFNYKLQRMNDEQKASFSEIADWIEANVSET